MAVGIGEEVKLNPELRIKAGDSEGQMVNADNFEHLNLFNPADLY